jgi:primary-amine oxidase
MKIHSLLVKPLLWAIISVGLVSCHSKTSEPNSSNINQASTIVANHPLDGLTADEIKQTVVILNSAGLSDQTSFYPLIELSEPPKDEVLAWKEGMPLIRKAYVNFSSQAGAKEALINLTSKQVEKVAPLKGEPMLLLEEFMSSMKIALEDKDFIAGLAKRHLKPSDVFCLPLTAGNFLQQAEKGKRLMKVPCYVNPTGTNYYARPIEGLFAEVDLKAGKVVQVVDEGVVPVPEDGWGYSEKEIEKRTKLKDVASNSGSGSVTPNFKINGAGIEWDIWKFRYRVDKRPGVVVSAVSVNDGERWRSVLYQANLSEVFVPYQDPGKAWYWRTYMDSGEYGFGVFLSPLVAGKDCPKDATFLPALVHQDNGQPVEIPNAICVFERDIGRPAWRHYEIFAQTEKQAVPAEGRAAKELVLRSASQVGNYDYLVDYVFQQNGSMNIDVISTGIDAVKGVQAKHLHDASAKKDTKYGSLIAPNLVAPNHDHYFNFRLDFDIDGTQNTFYKTSLDKGTVDPKSPRQSFWVANPKPVARELEGRLRIDNSRPALYTVANPNIEGKLGHNPSYAILPKDTVAYGPYDFEKDPPMKRNAYIGYSFWNTLYDQQKKYAGGKFAFQSDGSDTLATWVKKNRPIENKDVVTWYTIGFHHVPHTEDWPVMSGHQVGIELRPYNFFPFNPAIAIRNP